MLQRKRSERERRSTGWRESKVYIPNDTGANASADLRLILPNGWLLLLCRSRCFLNLFKIICIWVVNLLISRFGNKMAISVSCLCWCVYFAFVPSLNRCGLLIHILFHCLASPHFFCFFIFFLHFCSHESLCLCASVWLNDSIGILTILYAFRLNSFSFFNQDLHAIDNNNGIVPFIRSRLPPSYTVSCIWMPLYNTNRVNACVEIMDCRCIWNVSISKGWTRTHTE